LRRIPKFFVLPLLFLAGSCNTVEFYQKAALSDPTMQYTESPAQLHWQQKVQFSDEGAAGGIGTTAGGGCGCY
jgi:hypothetical protein